MTAREREPDEHANLLHLKCKRASFALLTVIDLQIMEVSGGSNQPVTGTCWETAAARLPPALSPDTATRSGSTEYWSSTPCWRKCFTTRYTSSKGTGKW